jgi:HD-like signal output (HDOD) protein
MNQDKLTEIVDKVQKLPTLPSVANKITSLINDPTCTAIRLAEVINKDQSLTTRVLRLVNSAFYSLSAEVTNVKHGIALLGFKTISQMVISISVFDVFAGKYGEEFDRRGFWKHSIGCGVISKIVAQRTQYPKEDDCFTAGLLHDIGKVVLDQYLHEDMIQVIQRTREKEISFGDAEEEVLGLNHADIGGQVMKKWNIPLPVLVAVQHHHQTPNERNGSSFSQDLIVDIVRLSDVLCKCENIGYTGDSISPVLEEELWERLPLDNNSIDDVVKKSAEEIEKASILIDLT